MYQIHCLNRISPRGMELWGKDYPMCESLEQADAALVRSADLHETRLPPSLLAIARAGAGVNNLPLTSCSEAGIVVFNTPGGNAGSVMELALCGMLLACRDIVGGINWVQSVKDFGEVASLVEKQKARFSGHEIRGKKLGVIGLGAVGGPLANAARKLGMTVYGYDPFISIDAAWHLDSHIIRVGSLEALFASCDILSLHVPLLDTTRGMIDAKAIAMMKPGAIVLNFARDLLVKDDDMAKALTCGRISRYVTDFPNDKTVNMPNCIAIPHLGASTEESEDNCAKMAVSQLQNYLENGNILNSVNYPGCDMGLCRTEGRIAILHRNIPNSLGQFTGVIAGENINIDALMNKSRGEYAYSMLDLDRRPSSAAIDKLKQLPGVLRVRIIK